MVRNSKKSFFLNRFRMFQIYFKSKKLISNKNSIENFSWTLPFFDEIGQKGKFSEETLLYVELVRFSLRTTMAPALSST